MQHRFLKPPLGTLSALVVVGVTGTMLIRAPQVLAHDSDDHGNKESKIQQGFAIAPVPLNLNGKDRELVGLGSYIVNALADCNGCHTNNPQTEFTPSGNPYLLPPVFSGNQAVNPATYLGGGNDMAQLGNVHILSRNLTPDKSGLPIGGRTFDEFEKIIRTGVDLDHLHPTCAQNATDTSHCLPFPFNGDLLQVMPWPSYQNLSEHELRAIYEYLKAIPCVAGPADPNDPRHNDCQ